MHFRNLLCHGTRIDRLALPDIINEVHFIFVLFKLFTYFDFMWHDQTFLQIAAVADCAHHQLRVTRIPEMMQLGCTCHNAVPAKSLLQIVLRASTF